MNFQEIIENPLIYDGTGSPPFHADIGIVNGRIADIGDLSAAMAQNRISGLGLALCPGFIDAHSHADMAIHYPDHHRLLEPLVRQGVTTFVGGNCGASLAPISDRNADKQFAFFDFFLGKDQSPYIHWKSFGQMLQTFEKQGLLVNCGVLAPHGILRLHAMGDSTGLASKSDIEHMRRNLAQCLEAGALGMSTGLMYFPGLAADENELMQLAREVRQYEGVLTSHLRSYNSDTLQLALDEVLNIGREAQIPVQISHFFCVPNHFRLLNRLMTKMIKGVSLAYNRFPFPLIADAEAGRYLEMIARRIAKGERIGLDAMPTSAGFTHLLALFPPWSLKGGMAAILERIGSKAERKKIFKSIQKGRPTWPHRSRDAWAMNFFGIMGWDCTFIMSVGSDRNRHLVGKSIAEIGRLKGQHPFEAACDLALTEKGRVLIFQTPTFPGDLLVEDFQRNIFIDPNVSIVTDSILLGYGLPSHLFYDCYPRFLAKYANNGHQLPLTEAIRKCTHLPATQLQIKKRGQIAKGFWADMVLFDADRLASNATIDHPDRFPSGVLRVWINGHAILDDSGFHPDPRPGRIVRRGED